MVKNKVTDEGGGEAVPFSGNNVPDETYRHYYKEALKVQQEVERIQELLKAAKDTLNGVLKVADGAGVPKDAIKYALKVRLLDKDDLIAEERAKARMMALSGVWPSIQTDFFGTMGEPADLTNETTIDMAYDHGHTCGVKGENRTINPHHHGTEKWDAWDRGWLTGQGNNVEKLAPKGSKKRMTKKEQAEAFANAEVAQEPGETPDPNPSDETEPLFQD